MTGILIWTFDWFFFSMSPSRLMAIMDPLLNTGFLWRCLAAYAGIKGDDDDDDESLHDDLESATVTRRNDSSSEKRRKIDRITSSPGQTVPESIGSDNDEPKSQYIRGDTYYARLGIFSRKKGYDDSICMS